MNGIATQSVHQADLAITRAKLARKRQFFNRHPNARNLCREAVVNELLRFAFYSFRLPNSSSLAWYLQCPSLDKVRANYHGRKF